MSDNSEHKIEMNSKSLRGGILLFGLGIGSYASLKVGFLNLNVLDFKSTLLLIIQLDMLFTLFTCLIFYICYLVIKFLISLLKIKKFKYKFIIFPIFWGSTLVFLFFLTYNKYLIPTYFSNYPWISTWKGLIIIHYIKIMVFISLSILFGYFFTIFFNYIYAKQRPFRIVLIIIFFMNFLVLFVLTVIPGPSTRAASPDKNVAKLTGGKVLVVGWDGATWKVIDPLLKKGLLPNLNRLIKTGHHCMSESLDISGSPMVWNSISTGRLPDEHTIMSFTEYPMWGLTDPVQFPLHGAETRLMNFLKIWKRHLIPSNRTAMPTIWEVARDWSTIKTGVVDWFGTSPAEKINGYMMTSRFYDQIKKPLKKGEQLDFEKLSADFYSSEISTVTFEKMIDSSWNEHLKEFKQYSENNPGMHNVDIDRFYAQLVPKLLKTDQPDLFLVTFFATDSIGHYYWPGYEPQYFSPKLREEQKNSKDILPGYYEYLDSVLGNILAEIDLNDTCVIVISDHGMEPVIGAAPTQRASHDNSTPGMLVCSGFGISHSVERESCSILDIFPLINSILGIPVSEELDGRIHPEFYNSEFLETNPPIMIPSYGKRNFEFSFERESEDRSAEKEQLKRLMDIGYFK